MTHDKGSLIVALIQYNLLIQWYSKGIYKFRYIIIEAIKKVFKFESVFEKMRFKDTEYTGGHVLGKTPEFPIVIEENFTFYT